MAIAFIWGWYDPTLEGRLILVGGNGERGGGVNNLLESVLGPLLTTTYHLIIEMVQIKFLYFAEM